MMYARIAPDEGAIGQFGAEVLEQLADANRIIYEKCRAAMLANGITEGQLAEEFQALKQSKREVNKELWKLKPKN